MGTNQLVLVRKREGYTQAEMARMLEVSPATYNMYESGKRSIPANIVEQLEELLNIKRTDLFVPSRFNLLK